MPRVIVNTSPIQYLYQTNLLDLLKTLYGQISLPQSVFDEISEGILQNVALPCITSIPWIRVCEAQSKDILPLITALGAGEREAIALAQENINDSLIILDDALARRYARLLGVQCTGTLGVFLKAKKEGYLSQIAPILNLLDSLDFRLSTSTRASVLKIAEESP